MKPSLHRLMKLGGGFLLAAAAVSAAKQLPLRNDSLALTPQGRQELKYLVSCALPAEDTVNVSVGGETFSFPGNLGWVPDWTTRPMSDLEQRRISSCMLARTNFFGKPVHISLRSDDSLAPATLQTTPDERLEYRYFEGGFFGNLFVQDAVGYVCVGDTAAGRQKHLESLFRVCALAQVGAPGFSRCVFKMVGLCKDKPFVQAGVDYSKDVLWVYLPGPKSKSSKLNRNRH